MSKDTPTVHYSDLRRNVKYLGQLLGQTIAGAQGEPFLALIEEIRGLSRAAREGDAAAREQLVTLLCNLDNTQLVPVARAFSQFLNLANIADQHHKVSRSMDPVFSASKTLSSALQALAQAGISPQDITASVKDLKIELVLTAHPTEIMRRTLIHKHAEIGRCLSTLELDGLTPREIDQTHNRLRELIAQVWYGDDFRVSRPSPVDEAKWGFAVVEDSLWQAVPEFLRRLDRALNESCGQQLPLHSSPVTFASWMGGDRDGNPNVTAKVTRQVLLLSKWQAVDLYHRDVNALVEELSMTVCNSKLRELSGGAHEPYRHVLRTLRALLRRTRSAIEGQLQGLPLPEGELLSNTEQLWQPLHACYQSMLDCGMDVIANSALLDLLRKVQCFGVHLVSHDIRQDSARHTQALSELTDYLQLGNYAQWSEHERQQFLLTELASPRPLIPTNWQPDAATQEVLDTFQVVAEQPEGALKTYVISMARQPSDILAVHLLLKATGCAYTLPVTPLFETLEDLRNASAIIDTLLQFDWYRQHINGQLMVMIGYSDSAKDAGVLAASWIQYTAQEQLLAVCEKNNVKLTLFHGRGGTIGRGGAPAQAALLSQPPGSLQNGLRVTEQGETIRAKLGWTSLAVKTLALYTSAICRANLMTPPAPKPEWRALMDTLAEQSCNTYRATIRDEKDFVAYFHHATPEQELARLPLGSRPARRAGSGGIESLRAIPWIFAWSQNRLMLPAWLGAGDAIQQALDANQGDTLREMAAEWPFFSTRLSMLEMVFAKTDADLSAYYDERLVPDNLKRIGERLRAQLEHDKHAVLNVTGDATLLANDSWARESIQLRNFYIDPLNVLQVELLRRNRQKSEEHTEQAILVTIAGIAAGMRNTG